MTVLQLTSYKLRSKRRTVYGRDPVDKGTSDKGRVLGKQSSDSQMTASEIEWGERGEERKIGKHAFAFVGVSEELMRENHEVFFCVSMSVSSVEQTFFGARRHAGDGNRDGPRLPLEVATAGRMGHRSSVHHSGGGR